MSNRLGIVSIHERPPLLEATSEDLIAIVVNVERIAAAVIGDKVNGFLGELDYVCNRIYYQCLAVRSAINSIQAYVRPFVKICLMALEDRLHPLATHKEEGEADFR